MNQPSEAIPGRWWWSRPLADLTGLQEDVAWRGTNLAAQAESPIIPQLPYTESSSRYVILRHHVSRGQIAPGVLKKMNSEDLEYLAGAPALNPTQLPPFSDKLDRRSAEALVAAEVKVAENAHRANRELHRRTLVWAGVWSAVIGSTLGGAVVLASTWLSSPPSVTNEIVVPTSVP